MKITHGLKESLRTSLHHVSQFPDLSQRSDVCKEELGHLADRLASYGRRAPTQTKLAHDIYALRTRILGHRSAMRSLIIEMKSAYNGINRSGYVSVAQSILAMRDGETLHNRTLQREAWIVVTAFDAQWRRMNGMWDEARGFAAQVEYLGNCCA